MFNFAKVVEWPSHTFQSEKAPTILCVFSHDSFGSALDEIIRGKAINNREVLTRRIDELSDLKSCQLVLVSRVEDRCSEVLRGVKETSALVVGEGEGLAERGGEIQFFPEDNKLRFAVNVDAIQRARLTISPKRLALARIVRDQGHPGRN